MRRDISSFSAKRFFYAEQEKIDQLHVFLGPGVQSIVRLMSSLTLNVL